MQDAKTSIDESIAGFRREVWKQKLLEQAEADGMAQELGPRHFATFIDREPTLLVTFETAEGIRSISETHQPFGFELVKSKGWSHLCIISDGDTWFRDPKVYGFFDRLIDDGFFEDFERVVFYGAGPCGYAAAAFSVAAPGATVVAVQPQATLDARMTEWDDRFTEMRRVSFTDRYGYAPDMLDAAEHAFILYDPVESLDAMHATLFARDNVTRLRMRYMGAELQARLLDMNLLYRILLMAGTGKLNAKSFFKVYRARRSYPRYLKGLVAVLDRQNRPYLNMVLCRNVIARMPARRFRRRLEELEEDARAGKFAPPPGQA
ncbi:phosphoadenosine phosphosulfate reductase [Ruegeria pomeroyi]|uniref:Phosphoadenosine phosphosulfate reductase n=1 Tax=Ruegeria alba TaxID=2916756 RepID=A0ABS9NYI4_9RHOB|nr:phosphoadenosine phosphosulfate reductase [Ruegeria alba]MCE8524444.1 phosphoadenosine phosphosulfate reductase [Ruegeria pomeroyi]MCG6559298.1 phosphoadenosine phosphosulfate reductase [Ruegeria alba]